MTSEGTVGTHTCFWEIYTLLSVVTDFLLLILRDNNSGEVPFFLGNINIADRDCTTEAFDVRATTAAADADADHNSVRVDVFLLLKDFSHALSGLARLYIHDC
jgi:hypothetical protein